MCAALVPIIRATPVGPNRPISVYRSPRRALTLCPRLCMGIQPGARFPARSADALPTTLYGDFTQAMNRNRYIPRVPVLTSSPRHHITSPIVFKPLVCRVKRYPLKWRP